MLENHFYPDIERHKNKLRIDIAFFKQALFEAIFDNYDEKRMVYLQQQIILKEYYLKLLNNNNFDKVSSPIQFNPIQRRSIIDIV